MRFDDLGLNSDLLKTLSEKGYEAPTPVQQKIIPLILRGADVLACAPTGTGKTGAFCLPLIEILSQTPSKARMIRCLILVPTRELATQVSDNFKAYTKHNKLRVGEFIGGASIVQQKQVLAKGIDVAVATPGRFLDLYESGCVLPTEIKNVVLDEADRMLDMGFLPDLKKILGALPKMRQTVLLSATMAPEIKKLAQDFLMSPKEVMVETPSSTSENIEQFFVFAPKAPSEAAKLRQKVKIMMEIFKKHAISSAIIFCNKKHHVDKTADEMRKSGLKAEIIHGDLTQARRNKSIERLKSGEASFLVASDVAARGIDIMDLPCVINMDIPMNTEDYVHRIGRTGRAGAKGRAFTMVTADTNDQAHEVMQLIGKKIPFINDWAEGEKPERGFRSKSPSKKKEEKNPSKQESPSREEVSAQKKESRPVWERNPRGKSQIQEKEALPREKESHGKNTKNDPGKAVKGFGDRLPDFMK